MKLDIPGDWMSKTSSISSLFSRAPRFLLLGVLLASHIVTHAVQIGDILSVSKLGEPLRAEVALNSAADEHIDSSCISLVAPDVSTDDAAQYLTASHANLSVKNDAGKVHVVLSSHKPFNEVFAKFKLQVRCLGEGSISRTFTILPDIDIDAAPARPVAFEPDSTPAAEPVIPPTTAPTNSLIAAPAAPAAHLAAAQPNVQPRRHDQIKSPPAPRSRRIARAHRNSDTFQLKISGDIIDTSRIGKISDDEREFLLAKQKLLDADDQMSSILELQSQIKQLQDDLVAMKSQLSQLGVAPARIDQNDEPPAGASLNVTSAHAAVPSEQLAAATHANEAQQTNWRTWSWQLGLLGLAVFGVVWGLRRYADEKSANAPTREVADMTGMRPAQKAIEPAQIVQPAEPATYPAPPDDPSPVQPPAAPGEFTTKVRAMAQAAVVAKAAPAPAQPTAYAEINSPPSGDPESEIDAIIEEAQLYAAFNHPLRAVKILQEVLVDHPKKSEAWLLVLSIHSSLKNEHEFENNARAFLRYNPNDHETWKTIQILGRTLNPSHALYRDNSPVLTSQNVLGERRLIGDVLIDLEMITPESLHHCLAHYDPKQHGRFGAYLVTEKVITHEQLTQALVLQNSVNQGAPYTPPIDLEFAPPDRSWQG